MKIATNEKEERCATGIQGFDKLCEGGLIKDSISLVTGNAGAGKTTFLLQFLYNGVTDFEENGAYISFEPEPKDINRTAKNLGMDFEKLEKENSLLIIKMDPEMSIREMQDKLSKIIIKNNIKRLCLDPINVFSINLSKEIIVRKQVYDFLSFLKKLGVCIIITGETDGELSEKDELTEDIRFAKYLVDGVIELFSSGIAGEGDRALRITKMRLTNHKRGPVSFNITNKGIALEK